MILELFRRFLVISLLAFGGGQAALPLVERIAVREAGWVASADFAVAVAFGYVTPGPVLITATFIGYRAAGLPGALAATIGVFLMPWLLAAAAAYGLHPYLHRPWLRGFGAGAGPAVVGLLGVTALSLVGPLWPRWPYVGITVLAVVLATRTKIHPALIPLGGALAGAAVGLWGGI